MTYREPRYDKFNLNHIKNWKRKLSNMSFDELREHSDELWETLCKVRFYSNDERERLIRDRHRQARKIIRDRLHKMTVDSVVEDEYGYTFHIGNSPFEDLTEHFISKDNIIWDVISEGGFE